MIDPKGGEYRPLVVWTDSEGIVPSLHMVVYRDLPVPKQLALFGISVAEPGIYAAFEARRTFRHAEMLYAGEKVLSVVPPDSFRIPDGHVALVMRVETFGTFKRWIEHIILPDGTEGGYVFRR